VDVHDAKEQVKAEGDPEGAVFTCSAAQDPEYRLVKLPWRHGRKQQVEKGGIVKSLDKGQEDAGSSA
jgi:hypothetical protein